MDRQRFLLKVMLSFLQILCCLFSIRFGFVLLKRFVSIAALGNAIFLISLTIANASVLRLRLATMVLRYWNAILDIWRCSSTWSLASDDDAWKPLGNRSNRIWKRRRTHLKTNMTNTCHSGVLRRALHDCIFTNRLQFRRQTLCWRLCTGFLGFFKRLP